MLWVKCLECEINPKFHSLECQPFFSRLLTWVSMEWCVNSQPNGPCSVKEVATLKKQAEIYPGTKCRSEGRTSHTPNLSLFFSTPVWEYFFSRDCGVFNLLCHDCWLNSWNATGLSRFFRTSYFVFNYNYHLPHILEATRECMWITVAASSNNCLYCGASQHGQR